MDAFGLYSVFETAGWMRFKFRWALQRRSLPLSLSRRAPPTMVKRPRAASDAHEARTPQKRPRPDEQWPSQLSVATRKATFNKRNGQHTNGSHGTPATPRSETGRKRWELTPEEMELQEAEFERLHEQKIQRQYERKQQRRAAGTAGACCSASGCDVVLTLISGNC
jgi:hypothetical protein